MAKERFVCNVKWRKSASLKGGDPGKPLKAEREKEGLITFKNIELWQITRMTKFISNRQCGGKS